MPFLSILNRGARSSARSASGASGAGNDAGWVAPQRGGSQTRETSEAEPAGDDAAGDAPAAAPSTAISQGAVSQASLGNIFDAEVRLILNPLAQRAAAHAPMKRSARFSRT